MFPFALRIADVSKGADEFRVEISFDNSQFVKTAPASHFTFSVSPEDQELLRWYWEDFLDYPDRVAQRKAAQVERRMQEIGTRLFQSVFEPTAARMLWTEIQPRLGQTRIEILDSQLSRLSSLPWELMRDPKTGDLFAEGCGAFLRKPKTTKVRAFSSGDKQGPLRVLLVMWQPPTDPLLPFRPTARRLLRELSRQGKGRVSVDVLRPPTFGQLSTVLLEAEAMGHPYHVLQFDGYGVFADAEQEDASGIQRPRVQPGRHGYLVSDNSTWERTPQWLDGGTLGELMQQSRVPLLILNACRASSAPSSDEAATSKASGCLDAFHSLTIDALDKGVAGVLQLPYHLGSASSAQFLLKTYQRLARGLSLAEAVTEHRKWLREQAERRPRGLPFLGFDLAEKRWQRSQPESELTFGWVRREDWLVPIVYEPSPFRLTQPAEENGASIPAVPVAAEEEPPARPAGNEQAHLPVHGAPGFFGREDTLLAIDSLWPRHSVVLLHGDAASGKTETAVEFARWYREVGGVENTVLYTSFEQYKPLAALLDQLACVFAPALRKAEQQWEHLSVEERWEVALHLLNTNPVLWIWDGVDNLTGASPREDSAWNEPEREEFVDFLRTAQETQAKFLLVSRHEEKAWLSDLPVRFGIPPLPMRERLQLTRSLLEQHNLRLKNIEDWEAVLEFSQGNPLAIRFLVEQALTEDLKTRNEIDRFVERVRAVASTLKEDDGQGLVEPLRVTLRYIQRNTFKLPVSRPVARHFHQGDAPAPG